MSAPDAEHFSAWYAAMGETPDKDRIWTNALGLPDDVLSTSALTGPALDEIAGLLALGPDDVLLDLACGRAGYGLELVARSGARLVGLDLAAAAVEQARANAQRLGLAGRAELRVGDMTATGLDPASVTAVLCVDAAQFPPEFGATFVEAHRVLAPGGVAVFTCWEARDPQDAAVPEMVRRVDLAGGLRTAGFTEVQSYDRVDWLADEREAWAAVVGIPESADPAVRALQSEGRRALETGGVLRRVLATGRRSA
jgi:SAM-dependent methyltransferase